MAFVGCEDTDYQEPPIIPLFEPRIVTVTEGKSTSFTLGLVSLSSGNAGGLIYVYGSTSASATPTSFDLTSVNPSMLVTVSTGTNPDVMNQQGEVEFYYPGLIANESPASGLYVVDKDSLNFDASNWNITLTPSSTATFGVQLTQMPASDVGVTLSFNVPDVIVASPMTLTFSPGDYADPHTVTVTAPDIAFDEVQITISDDAGAVPPQRVSVEPAYVAQH